MQRTNLPTILAVIVGFALAGGLIYYAVNSDKDSKGDKKSSSGNKYELVTSMEKPVEFQLAEVPAGDKLDLTATVKGLDGKETKVSKLVGPRNVIMMLDGEFTRRTKRITKELRYLTKGGNELNFPVIVLLPRGTKTSDAENFARKRRIQAPVFIDDDGEFADRNDWTSSTAALFAEDGTIMQKFEPCEDWDERFGLIPPVTDDVLFWAWAIPEEGPEIDAAAKQAAVNLVRAALSADLGKDGIPGALTDLAGDPALAMKPELPVYVSLFRPGETKRLRGSGDSGSLGERLVAATREALDVHDRKEWVAEAADVRFLVDVPGPSFKVPGRELRTQWYFFEPGVDGVMVVNGEKEGVLLPAEVVTQGYHSPRVKKRDEKVPRMLAEACRRAGMSEKSWKDEETDLRRFRTTCFGEVIPGAGAADVYRGNVLIGDQTSEEILAAIKLGGRWLLDTVKEDGTFDYQYYPNEDKGSTDYSWVRHAGSVYGLFEMYELAYDEPMMADDLDDYIRAGAISVGGVYRALGKIPEDEVGDRYCLMEGNRCQSGSAALSLMTYISRPPKEHIHNPEYMKAIYLEDDKEKMDGLALAMLDMIDDDGKVFRSYREAMTKDSVEKEPLYYPGECMLALTRYYQLSGDERWLDGAKAIAENQMRIYNKNRWSNPDHWVMQALYLLFHATGDESYAETALKMGTHHASEQFDGPRPSPFPDYRGSYRRTNDVPRTTRAGSRTEAMMGVVRTAWEAGEDARIYEDAVLEATRHMSEQLFRPENSFWMSNPKRAMGALRMGVVDNHCRIDNNQHALVGMAGALEVSRKREGLQSAPTE